MSLKSSQVDLSALVSTRMSDPGSIARAAAGRLRPPPLERGSRLLVIAADHPGRGTLRVGFDDYAMADRGELLGRLVIALGRPGVNGFLGTPDVVEDLLLLNALDRKYVFGSMNRGGLTGSNFEVDDQYTSYTAPSIALHGLDGGKMLLRVSLDDPLTPKALFECARAVNELSSAGLYAMIEPFMAHREAGRLCMELTADSMVRVINVASALGGTSAFTWLKIPAVPDLERVLRASSLPTLVLGGEVYKGDGLDDLQRALMLPMVRGLVVGRRVLYPEDGDVIRAVDLASSILSGSAR